LEERLADIPYIVAAYLFDQLAGHDAARLPLKLEGGFILAATDYTLEKPEVRRLCAAADEAFKTAIKRWKPGEPLSVTASDSPKAAPFAKPPGDVTKQIFQFVR
jgi:hypothetical protein